MDLETLEARKKELEAELEKVTTNYYRLGGAIALINELVQKVLDGKKKDEPSTTTVRYNTSK